MLKFLVFNLIISLLFALYLYKKEKTTAYIKFFIMFLLPLVGIVLFLIFEVYTKLFKETDADKISMGDEKDLDFISLLLTKSNVDKELNLIPIEDALILNDNATKRSLIIDALKGDTYKYIGFLKKALKDSDTETSHYAATAVTEIKGKLMLSLQELEARYEKSNGDVEYLKVYSDVLRKYILSGLLDEKTVRKNMFLYSKLLGRILEVSDDIECYIDEKVNYDIKLKKYDEAEKYCLIYKEQFYKSERPYLLLLKLYYTKKDKKRFDEIISELRKSNVKIQQYSLRVLRFWLEGV